MNILVPKEYLQDLQAVIKVLEEIAVSNNLMQQDDIYIQKPKQFGVGELPVTIFIAGAVTAWFTKKWADTYLWPELQKRIDNPSKKVVEWIVQAIEDKDR